MSSRITESDEVKVYVDKTCAGKMHTRYGELNEGVFSPLLLEYPGRHNIISLRIAPIRTFIEGKKAERGEYLYLSGFNHIRGWIDVGGAKGFVRTNDYLDLFEANSKIYDNGEALFTI